jgi:hypothetical protein
MNKNGPLVFVVFIAFFSIARMPAEPLRPAWIQNKPRDTAAMLYFTSAVDDFAGEEEAKKAAVNAVYSAVAGNIIVYIQSSVSEKTQTAQSGSNDAITGSYNTLVNINTDSFTNIILSGIKTEVYSEAYYNVRNQKRYRAWALASISPRQADENRQAYSEKIEKLSQYYSNELSKQDSSFEALRACRRMLSELDPLQRSLVEYIGPAGRVNLHLYLNERIQTLAASVYSASVEFRGPFKFSDSEKDALCGALEGGLRAGGVSLRLVTQAGQARFTFVITAESGETAGMRYSRIHWQLPGLAIRLLFDNDSLLEPEYFPVTEFTREYLVSMTAKAIKEKTVFYQKIKERIDL